MIESLTKSQTLLLPEYAETWKRIALEPKEVDRPKAESLLNEAYVKLGLEPPKRIIWFASKEEMWLYAACIKRNTRHPAFDSVWDSVWASVRDSVRDSVRASVWASVGASVWDSVRTSVWAYIGSLFPIKTWKYTPKNIQGYPYQPCVDLWKQGIASSFDGETWRLHTNLDARIAYEISAKKLRELKF